MRSKAKPLAGITVKSTEPSRSGSNLGLTKAYRDIRLRSEFDSPARPDLDRLLDFTVIPARGLALDLITSYLSGS